jgi:hypothetical protein
VDIERPLSRRSMINEPLRYVLDAGALANSDRLRLRPAAAKTVCSRCLPDVDCARLLGVSPICQTDGPRITEKVACVVQFTAGPRKKEAAKNNRLWVEAARSWHHQIGRALHAYAWFVNPHGPEPLRQIGQGGLLRPSPETVRVPRRLPISAAA